MLKLQSGKITKMPCLVTAKCSRQMSCCQSLDAFSRAQSVTNTFGGRAPSFTIIFGTHSCLYYMYLFLQQSMSFQLFDLRTWIDILLTTMTHTHTHPFNGPFTGTTPMSRYQKGKTNLDFTKARDSEWQWHRLSFYRPDAFPAAQPTASKH